MTWPYVAGVVVGLVALAKGGFPYGFRDMLNSAQVFGSISVGVGAAALALLYTIGRSVIMDAIKASALAGTVNYHALLVRYVVEAIKWAIFLTVVSGALLAVKVDPAAWWHRYLFGAWTFFVTAALGTLWRAMSSLATLVTSP